MIWPRRVWARAARGATAAPATSVPPTVRNRRRFMLDLLGAHGVERFPVECDTVAGPFRRDRRARLQPQRLGNEALETEAVRLEIGSVRRRRQQVHGDV